MAVLWTWVTWGNAALFIIVFVIALLLFRYAHHAVQSLDEYSDDRDEAAGK